MKIFILAVKKVEKKKGANNLVLSVHSKKSYILRSKALRLLCVLKCEKTAWAPSLLHCAQIEALARGVCEVQRSSFWPALL